MSSKWSLTKKVCAGFLVAEVLLVGSWIVGEKYPMWHTLVAANVYADQLGPTQDELETMKWAVVDDLARCECGGHSWAEGFFRLDSNNKYSWGCLQFQENTVKHYVKVLWDKAIDGAEAKRIALSKSEARQLAYDIIFESKAGVAKDWVNCSRWHGLQSRVDEIKRLEK